MKRFSTLCIAAMFQVSALSAQSNQVKIQSPDKKTIFSLVIDQGQLQYAIAYRQKQVINPSELGLSVNDRFFGKGSAFRNIQRTTAHTSYPWRGVHSRAVDDYQGARISVIGADALPPLHAGSQGL